VELAPTFFQMQSSVGRPSIPPEADSCRVAAPAVYIYSEHQLETLIPWNKFEKVLAKRYPKGQLARPPYPLSTTLRIHAMQVFLQLKRSLH